VQDYNRRTGHQVHCYVPTHSLLNYAHWHIVSPESSLAQLKGCDGYIAQVWTGTSRTPNVYRGKLAERTFETAFLEYGAMQNLVRATGRRVWYLNDPVEDNPDHDWTDYRVNWESTLVASLFQPEVWHYEVAPWPERIFGGKYPRSAAAAQRAGIPPAYATELQTVMNALNDLEQPETKWDCGTAGLGVLVSDSLMFERGDPAPSDPHLGNVYGLALPFLKRGMPISPVQLENVSLPHYLDGFRVLLLSYNGMKPMTPQVHVALSDWVKAGGVLVMVDDDSDPFNSVPEWWNTGGLKYATPRQHLFEQLGVTVGVDAATPAVAGRGRVLWVHQNPAAIAAGSEPTDHLVQAVKNTAQAVGVAWKETNHLLLRRGPYVIAAGLEESINESSVSLTGKYLNLFDPKLLVMDEVHITPGSRQFLVDLTAAGKVAATVLASACKTLPVDRQTNGASWLVEGVEGTPAIVLLAWPKPPPRAVTLGDKTLAESDYSLDSSLLRVRFVNQSSPRRLTITY
jgi:hypothetical protein